MCSQEPSPWLFNACKALPCLADGEGEDDAPTKGLFALPFMRRAQEKRRAQAQAEAAAMLHDMEAADACAELDSSDEAANWAAAEPTAGHGGRLRFGGAGQQQHSHLVSDAVEDYIVSQYGVSLPGSCNRPEAAHEYMTVGIVLNVG